MKHPSIRPTMLQLAKIIHEAIGIESPRAFIAVIGISFLVFGLFVGWAIDRGYRVKLQEDAKRTPPAITAQNTNTNQPPQPLKDAPSVEEKPKIHIEQHSEGPNSPNVATLGDNSPITINPEINPNAPVITYHFNGTRRITSPGRISTEADKEYFFFIETMEPLLKQEKWQELVGACEGWIVKTPEWLTPYLYSGIALANLGKKAQAVERLTFVEKKAGRDSQYSEAERILKTLEGQ